MEGLAQFKQFFIPSESNNYRAKALHHSSLTSLGLLFLVFQIFISSFILLKPQILGYASQISPMRIIELTNQERAKVGAPPLKLNPFLVEASSRKAGDMFAFGYWSHNSPSGRTPWDFFKETGYRFSIAGENLARDFATPEAVVSAWMASPTHRANLLNPNYKEIGISVIDGNLGGVETTLVVQHFATPTPSSPQEGLVSQAPPGTSPVFVGAEGGVILPETNLSLGKASGEERPLVNPFALTQKGALVLLGALLLVIGIDGFWVWRKKVFRLSGRSLAHGVFLLVTFLMVLFSQQGAIL